MSYHYILRHLYDFSQSKADIFSQLTKVEFLMKQEKYLEVLEVIGTVETDFSYDLEYRMYWVLLKSHILAEQGKHENGLKLAQNTILLSKRLKNELLKIDGMIAKINSLKQADNLSKGLEVSSTCENFIQNLNINVHSSISQRKVVKERLGALEYLRASMFRRKSKFDAALKSVTKALTIKQEFGNNYEVGAALNLLGTLYLRIGELQKATDFLEEALGIFKKLESQLTISKILNNLGTCYWKMGRLSIALDYFNQSSLLFEKLGDERYRAMTLMNMGVIFRRKGQLKTALKYYKESLRIFDRLNLLSVKASALNNIGIIYKTQGRFKEALECYHQSLNINKDLGNSLEIANSLNNIGNIYKNKGDLVKSATYFKKALKRFEQLKNRNRITIVLSNLIKIAIQNKDQEKAQELFSELQDIAQAEENQLISQYYRLTKAIMLKNTQRFIKVAEAQKILQDIAQEEVVNIDTTVEAMLNLAQLLLLELRQSDPSSRNEILLELKTLLNRLLKTTQNQRSFYWLANTHFLSAKVALIELDFDSAKMLLHKAQLIAEDKGMQKLALKLSNQYDEILKQEEEWESISLEERMEFAEIDQFINQMIYRRSSEIITLKPEIPKLLMIITQGGKTIYSQSYTDNEYKEQLIGTFFVAIDSFMDEAFAESGSIERIKHGQSIILIKNITPIIFVYIFHGQSYLALKKLNNLTKAICSDPVWNELKTIDDTGSVKCANQQLKTLIDKHFQADLPYK